MKSEHIKNEIRGPFDIIGDIHGCYEETIELLGKLGYLIKKMRNEDLNFGIEVSHPENRQVIFVGDLVNKGPNSVAVLKLAMSMINSGIAWCVKGNHEVKLHRLIKGKGVERKPSLKETTEQLNNERSLFILQLDGFIDSLPSHYVFDNGQLAIAHAGIKEHMLGDTSKEVRRFCIYGQSKDKLDQSDIPEKYDWASEYKGKAKVVYGHTPVAQTDWVNNTINIDTGCVYGGHLTALRYPENELVSVKAKEIYSKPAKIFKKSKKNAE
ncbi:metallophosphoesterase [Marivirga sp. S37H4]|uniref:Metallophosphoesterase n=1 Tax=Marivirga aurantiaca TaxID=2802615 RepID=A0A934WVT5_9BACT|nr:metallophosphoesterase [Marivirga aurantiaca]MBK6263969.1 metallophosphoesterase [Marivirga aurantiaca]